MYSQPVHDVKTTSYGCYNDVKTLQRRCTNLVLTLCVGWVVTHSDVTYDASIIATTLQNSFNVTFNVTYKEVRELCMLVEISMNSRLKHAIA